MVRYRSLLLVFGLVILIGAVYSKGTTISTGSSTQEGKVVISLGQDLTDEQKKMVLDYLSPSTRGKELTYITVSNQEERRYLEGLVDESLIGTKAISSVYCELFNQSKGIEVKTNNITDITPFMYANALSTAGIENARVVVTAPFKVSGTAALTGILKAFESASGERLDEEAKQTAHLEIAEVSKLGKKLGKTNAEKIIYEAKRQVVEKGTSDPQEIKKIVLEVSADVNVNLSQEEVDRIVKLMQQYRHINLSIDGLNQQLKGLSRNVAEIKNSGSEIASIFNQLLSAMRNLLVSIQNAIS
ncbi:MAG: DUF1002 domain-containing protein [Syntrophomonadaceae bacterium]|jgi:uncharacterized protein YpuA (DUF1002 family)